jgi:NAD(P)H-dependent flavin oxidoreductase YrpB (nitropropane dioxygenase family)
MGGICTGPDLPATVSQEGGFGMVGAVNLPVGGLEAIVDEVARRTDAPFGVGLLMPFLDRECVEMAARRTRLVDFFYADPDAELVAAVHSAGALAAWQVGSVEEARAATDAGCDLVVAQGIEAGGHVRGQVGLLPLLDGVLAAVDVPVVAAGGIASAAGAAAAMAAGADAVRVGTRFLAAEESPAHPSYVEAILGARPEDTVLTETFSVMWPDAPHRVLRSCIDAVTKFDGEVVGEMEMPGMTLPVPRFAVPCPTNATTGAVQAMALYAGQSVGAIDEVRSVAEIVAELAGGAERGMQSVRRSP